MRKSPETMAEEWSAGEQSRALLAWYDANGRDLPWRMKGSRADPYHVWLSEIMLQQTTVAAVKDYYRKFISRWPDVAALAAAPLEDVLTGWAGLGYYARARNLHACAREVVKNWGGVFPQNYEQLITLPGIGPYTAAAIAAIAFDGRHAAVDGNVERVMSRYHAIETPLPESKPLIRDLTQALVPEFRAGDFAQAIMDLGATVCTPKSPACVNCPWTEHCQGRLRGNAATLPRKLAKKAVPTRRAFMYWLQNGERVLLRRRAEKGLLGGMMEVPSSPWVAELPKDLEGAPVAAKWKKLPGVVAHTFTHFHFEMTVLVAEGEFAAEDEWRWVKFSELASEALPSAMRKVVVKVLGA